MGLITCICGNEVSRTGYRCPRCDHKIDDLTLTEFYRKQREESRVRREREYLRQEEERTRKENKERERKLKLDAAIEDAKHKVLTGDIDGAYNCLMFGCGHNMEARANEILSALPLNAAFASLRDRVTKRKAAEKRRYRIGLVFQLGITAVYLFVLFGTDAVVALWVAGGALGYYHLRDFPWRWVLRALRFFENQPMELGLPYWLGWCWFNQLPPLYGRVTWAFCSLI